MRNVDIYSAEIKKVRLAFESKKKAYRSKLKQDTKLYFSDHFCQRVVDRGMVKDVDFLFAIGLATYLKAAQTTYTLRTYRVSYHGLCCVVVLHNCPTEPDKRMVVVKTIWEKDSEYFDEDIKLG